MKSSPGSLRSPGARIRRRCAADSPYFYSKIRERVGRRQSRRYNDAMSTLVHSPQSYWSPGNSVVFCQVCAWTILDALVLQLEVPPEVRDWKEVALLAAVGGQCATVAGWLALGDG